jgi:hypothetical protein
MNPLRHANQPSNQVLSFLEDNEKCRTPDDDDHREGCRGHDDDDDDKEEEEARRGLPATEETEQLDRLL